MIKLTLWHVEVYPDEVVAGGTLLHLYSTYRN